MIRNNHHYDPQQPQGRVAKEKAQGVADPTSPTTEAKAKQLLLRKKTLCYTPDWKICAMQSIARRIQGNQSDTQCKRLYRALQSFPVTTLEARRYLDILHPAGRVNDLKHKQRVAIDTRMVRQETEAGKLHCVAQYSLSRSGAHSVVTAYSTNDNLLSQQGNLAINGCRFLAMKTIVGSGKLAAACHNQRAVLKELCSAGCSVGFTSAQAAKKTHPELPSCSGCIKN